MTRARHRRTLALVGLLAVVALTGCAGLAPEGGSPFGDDPFGLGEGDLGRENGVAADDRLAVTESDGLNESEREVVVSRTIARLELLRDREFDGNVTVEVIDRAAYRNRSTGLGVAPSRWNDVVWEGLFLVGEDRRVDDAFGETLATSVQGYYQPANDSIVIVSDSPTPRIDRSTLAHELVHAFQDQAGLLGGASPPTQDEQLARRSLVEGEARYLEARYERGCAQRWRCLDRPERSGGSGGSAADGVFLVLYQPYATGPQFVADLKQRGGWGAVSDAYDRVPNSTEQVLHPEAYPDEEPANVTVPDRSTESWERFDHDPVADTLGEASIFATFAANDVVEPDSRYAYQSRPSAGWAGDALVPYRNGSEEYGYVWETVWDTKTDARQFRNAYRELLRSHGGTETSTAGSGTTYVLPESDPYGDAFRVVREGRTVRIVNAPTRAALDGVHRPPSGSSDA